MPVKFEYSIESVVITSATGVEKEIKDLVMGISFFESLHLPYIKCEMSIADAANLIETMPIVGQEKVKLYVKDSTTGLSIKREFYVSAIQDYTKGNSQSSIYVLKLVTPEYLYNGIGTISQAYSGRISDIVKKVIKNYLKYDIKNIEDSLGDYRVIIPTWTPYKALDWLLRRAKSKNNYPYVFYDSLYDGLTFESYEQIFDKDIFNKYVHRGGSVAKDDADQTGAMRNTALQYDIESMSNVGKNLMAGNFGRGMHIVDHAKRSYQFLMYDYLKDFKKRPRLSKAPYIVDTFKVDGKSLNEFDAIHIMNYKNSLANEDGLNNYNNEVEFTRLENEPFLGQIGLVKLNMTVKGRVDLSVGKVIDFEVERNRPTSIGNNKNSNEYLSGKYIVQNIHHKMEEGKYYIILDAVKESLGKKVE